MSFPGDLRQIEKKAYRTTFEDGLLDINIGGVLASFGLLNAIPEDDSLTILRFGLFVLGMILSTLVYQLGKRFISEPRMGQVTFSPKRQHRKSTLVIVLSVNVGLQALFVLFTFLLLNNPGLAARFGIISSNHISERLLVSVIAALFVGLPMTLIAYISDFQRAYYIAILLSATVFMMVWADRMWLLLIAAALVLIPGVFVFIRFLQKYPRPPAEMPHVG